MEIRPTKEILPCEKSRKLFRQAGNLTWDFWDARVDLVVTGDDSLSIGHYLAFVEGYGASIPLLPLPALRSLTSPKTPAAGKVAQFNKRVMRTGAVTQALKAEPTVAQIVKEGGIIAASSLDEQLDRAEHVMVMIRRDRLHAMMGHFTPHGRAWTTGGACPESGEVAFVEMNHREADMGDIPHRPYWQITNARHYKP